MFVHSSKITHKPNKPDMAKGYRWKSPEGSNIGREGPDLQSSCSILKTEANFEDEV